MGHGILLRRCPDHGNGWNASDNGVIIAGGVVTVMPKMCGFKGCVFDAGHTLPHSWTYTR